MIPQECRDSVSATGYDLKSFAAGLPPVGLGQQVAVMFATEYSRCTDCVAACDRCSHRKSIKPVWLLGHSVHPRADVGFQTRRSASQRWNDQPVPLREDACNEIPSQLPGGFWQRDDGGVVDFAGVQARDPPLAAKADAGAARVGRMIIKEALDACPRTFGVTVLGAEGVPRKYANGCSARHVACMSIPGSTPVSSDRRSRLWVVPRVSSLARVGNPCRNC